MDAGESSQLGKLGFGWFEFSLNVFAVFGESSTKNICHYSKRVRTYHLLCQRPGCYHSASKTHVRDRIFKWIFKWIFNSCFSDLSDSLNSCSILGKLHCATSIERVFIVRTSCSGTDFTSQMKLTKPPLIHCFEQGTLHFAIFFYCHLNSLQDFSYWLKLKATVKFPP